MIAILGIIFRNFQQKAKLAAGIENSKHSFIIAKISDFSSILIKKAL